MDKILFTREEFNENTSEYLNLQVHENDDIILSYYKYDNNSQTMSLVDEIVFNLQNYNKTGIMFAVFVDNKNKLTLPINFSMILGSRDGFNLLRFYNVHETLPLITFCIIDNKTVIISNRQIKSNLPINITDKIEPKEIYIEVFGESYLNAHKIGNARRKIMVELDPNNSLSYIEAQLDLLTAIAFGLLTDKQKEQFKEIWLNTTVTNIKDFNRCMAELQMNKAKVRELQLQYYEEKNK